MISKWPTLHARRFRRPIRASIRGCAAAFAVVAVAAGCTPEAPANPTSASITLGGETVVVTGPPGSALSLAVADLGSLPIVPSDVIFPIGALGIEVAGVADGSVVTLTIGLQTPVDGVRKLIAGAWDPFPMSGGTGAVVSASGTTITLNLQDGGRGDLDGLANGVIVDPIAPSEAAPTGACYKANVFGGADVRVVGPPNTTTNLAAYLSSFDGTCSGARRPAAEEYAFYVTAATQQEALGIPPVDGVCQQVWQGPVGQAFPFAQLYYSGPNGQYVCLGSPPVP